MMQLLEAGILTKKQVAEKLVNEGIISLSDDEIEAIDETMQAEEEFNIAQGDLKPAKNSLIDKLFKIK